MEKLFLPWVAAVAIGCLALPTTTLAAVTEVEAGYDLFETAPGTTFAGVQFTGVPLGTFDFGSGPVGVGSTDTIVRRHATASVDVSLLPEPDTIPIELVALQLVSVAPVDFGLGFGFYYITLQSTRGGPDSTGQMTIHFADQNGGSFDSFFDVFFDIRLGALDGPIAVSDQLRLQSAGTPWDRTPPSGAVAIDGVNRNLNGLNQNADFWPVGPVTESHPSGAQHIVDPASVPEPAAFVVWSVVLCVAAGSRYWLWRAKRLTHAGPMTCAKRA